MTSILGEFYTKFKIKHEDLVSQGLVYILGKSEPARNALGRLIQNETGIPNTEINFSEVNYSTQRSGDNQERPDISGTITNDEEVLIIEAKFWAALTDNQPIEYLNRLNDKGVLMFLCPKKRQDSIFKEINDRLFNEINDHSKKIKDQNQIDADNQNYTVDFDPDHKNYHFIISDNNKTKKLLIIQNWDKVLELIKDALHDNSELLSDINQIIGLKEKLDNDAFIPFQASDFAPETGKKICSYSDIIDSALKRLEAENKVDFKNGKLMQTGQKYGYSYYFRLDKRFLCGLNVFFNTWKEDAGTFFWFSSGSKEVYDGSVKEYYGISKDWMEKIANEFTPPRRCYHNPRFGSLLPIFVPHDKLKDEVVSEIVKQIKKIMEILNNLLPK